VCHNFTCQAPTTSAEVLETQLQQAAEPRRVIPGGGVILT
jgi:hypothetical protein